MDDVARAAGVGKGTLFRRFGDRAGLLHALYDRRLGPLRQKIAADGPPLGPSTPAPARVAAVLEAVVVAKLDILYLSAALETAGGGGPATLFGSAGYQALHELLVELLTACGVAAPMLSAHFLLGAVRADLLLHLRHDAHLTSQEIIDGLRSTVAKVLADGITP